MSACSAHSGRDKDDTCRLSTVQKLSVIHTMDNTNDCQLCHNPPLKPLKNPSTDNSSDPQSHPGGIFVNFLIGAEKSSVKAYMQMSWRPPLSRLGMGGVGTLCYQHSSVERRRWRRRIDQQPSTPSPPPSAPSSPRPAPTPSPLSSIPTRVMTAAGWELYVCLTRRLPPVEQRWPTRLGFLHRSRRHPSPPPRPLTHRGFVTATSIFRPTDYDTFLSLYACKLYQTPTNTAVTIQSQTHSSVAPQNISSTS